MVHGSNQKKGEISLLVVPTRKAIKAKPCDKLIHKIYTFSKVSLFKLGD